MTPYIRTTLVVFLLLAATTIYTSFFTTVTAVPPKRPLDRFPTRVGDFHRVDTTTFSKKIQETAGMDQYLMWFYADDSGYTLGLYIGYYETQSEGHIIHSPQNCMPGSGWEFSRDEIVPLATMVPGHKGAIRRVFLQNGLDKQLAHYWYQGRGRILANEYLDRALLIWDTITRRQTQGALVRITGPISDPTADLAKQEAFITALVPILDTFIP